MSTENGFLVVLKSSAQVLQSYNPKYRGLYRTRPFYIEEYESGFTDPYFSGKFTDEAGFIPTLSLAEQAWDELSKVEDPAGLEILYVRAWEGPSPGEQEHSQYSPLGFDIACYTPFWSVVADSPNPADPEFHRFLMRLNKFGLFDSPKEAGSYLEEYTRVYPDKQDLILRIWDVYLVQTEIPALNGHKEA